MKRSRQSRMLVFIGLLVTVVFSVVQFGLGPRAEAADKSEPVAAVGPDFKVLVGESVTADGRLSSDPSGKELQFKWELIQVPPGSTAKLSKKNSPTASFTADKHGRYIVELRVSNNGMKWSDRALLTVTTAYPENALVPVNTRLVSDFQSRFPTYRYSMDVGGTYYAAPPYTEAATSTATGFQVLVLERATLLPATLPSPYSYNQSFSGTAQGYSDMIAFLASLTDKGLMVMISSLYINELDNFPDQKTNLVAQIQRLGGTENFKWLGKNPYYVYTLIGIPGVGAGKGYEMCGWDHYGIPTTASIQGILTKDKYSNFQFIYPDFTPFETKSWADSGGNFSGSIVMGSVEVAAPLPGGKLPPGQGGFQVVHFRRDNADWGSAPPYASVFLTNVPGQEAQSVKDMVMLLKQITQLNANGFGYPSPDSYMVIIQSIGVPFGATSLYDPQSIKNLEKVINNLGGTESTFHAILKSPGTAASPNKYSLMGIAANDIHVNMPTKPRLGPTESVEASTLRVQEDGSWTAFVSDGNVRGLINKNNQGMYVPFFTSEGVPYADYSLPLILFQDPTPWIAGRAGEDATPYRAAYAWISTFIWPSLKQQTWAKPEDLRTSYPVIDNPWDTVLSILNGVPIEQGVQEHLAANTDFSYAQYQFMRDQLIEEVTKVRNAQILFQEDILQFLTDLTLTQSFSLNAFYANAYTALGIDPTKANTTQNVLNMVSSVARQAQIMGCISLKPAVVVVASIVNLGVGIASRFIPDSVANPVAGDVSTTVQDLWQDLSVNYLREAFVARKSYELVASDWGKLQAAEDLYNKWDEDSRDLALTTMTVGFEAYFYKVLIPIAYDRLERIPGTQYSSPGDVDICDHTAIGGKCVVISQHAPDVPLPDYVTLTSQAWDPFEAREAKDLYWVYQGDHFTRHFIPGETLDNLFAPFDYADMTKLGVSRVDFFTRWPFSTDYYDCRYYECGRTGTLCYTCIDGLIDWCF